MDQQIKIDKENELFRKLVSQVPGMIYEFMRKPDGSFSVPFSTDKIKEIFGCTPEEVKDDFSPIAKVILKEDIDRVVSTINKSADELSDWRCEYRVQLPGKEIRWMLGHSTPEKQPDGSIIWYGFNTDITKEKENSLKLIASESRFRTLFESSSDALMTLEPPSWRFTSGNPAAVKMFNAKDEQEFISAEPWKLSPERQPDGSLSSEKAKKMIDIAMRDGSNLFEWTHRRISGEDFSAVVLLTRLTFGGTSFLQATVRDVEKQKHTEAEIKSKVQELETVNKLMIGRELKMVELKRRVEELTRKLEEKEKNAQ